MKHIEHKRKLIDIPTRTARVLGVMAASCDLSLKAYIERILEKEANNFDEDAILVALSLEPEANTPVSPEENAEILAILKSACE